MRACMELIGEEADMTVAPPRDLAERLRERELMRDGRWLG